MNLLPLGSIVVLKNGYKKLMIIGRKQIQQSENKIWLIFLLSKNNIKLKINILYT